LDSWFKADSEYSVLQHVGPKGILLNILLDDAVLTTVMCFSFLVLWVVFMPVWGALVNRFLVSGMLWINWMSWGRFVHLGLPFKLMVGQWILGLALFGFQRAKGKIKDRLVEIECEILNQAHIEERDAEILAEEEEIMENLIEPDKTGDDDDESDKEE
jgi:hypothetical protein